LTTYFDDQKVISNKFHTFIKEFGNSSSKYMTISLGLYIKNAYDKLTLDDIYKKTDEALYLAKQSGRNQLSLAK